MVQGTRRAEVAASTRGEARRSEVACNFPGDRPTHHEGAFKRGAGLSEHVPGEPAAGAGGRGGGPS
eukprot:5336752-Prymnesium_polylepis.1